MVPSCAEDWMAAQHQDREVNQTGDDSAKAQEHHT